MSIFNLLSIFASNSFDKTMDGLEYDYYGIMARYRSRSITAEEEKQLRSKLDPGSIFRDIGLKFSKVDDEDDEDLPVGVFNIAGMEFKVEFEPIGGGEKDWIDELLDDKGVLLWLSYVEKLDRWSREKCLDNSTTLFRFARWSLGPSFEDAISKMEKLVVEKMELKEDS